MKILFDNGTPKPIARSLPGHEITYARRIGWHELKNGELIERAEEAGYQVLLSTDKAVMPRSTSLSSKRSAALLFAPRGGRILKRRRRIPVPNSYAGFYAPISASATEETRGSTPHGFRRGFCGRRSTQGFAIVVL